MDIYKTHFNRENGSNLDAVKPPEYDQQIEICRSERNSKVDIII